MKIEIEITEEEITKAILPKVKTALIELVASYSFNEAMKQEMKNKVYTTLAKMIDDQMKDYSDIRFKIQAEMESKIKRQLTKLINAQEQAK